jgi:SdrD B-like domain
MRNFKLFLTLIISLTFQTIYCQAVVGIVYRDMNLNLVRSITNPVEPLEGGVIINVYDSGDLIIASYKSTLGTGVYPFTGPNYNIPNSGSAYNGIQGSNTGFIPINTKFRLEFINLTVGDFDNRSSSVRFLNYIGSPLTQDFGLNYNGAFYETSDPRYVFAFDESHTSSTQTLAQTTSLGSGLASTTAYTAEREESSRDLTGALWGVAYNKITKKLYASSMLKRAVGLGPKGMGGVYQYDYTNPTIAPAAPVGFDLQGVIPVNTATPIDLGTVGRNSIVGSDSFCSANFYINCRDMDAFKKVAKRSYGDIEMDESNKYLWLVNLNQGNLIRVDVSSGSPNLATVNTFAIIGAPGIPVYPASLGVLRPWALKFYRGRGYIGLVGDATASQLSSDLIGYVLSFDPNNAAAGFTTEITLNLNYPRERSEGGGLSPGATPSRNNALWRPWADTWSQTGLGIITDRYCHAQPILSGIEFGDEGQMMMAFTNRFAEQSATNTHAAIAGNNNLYSINNAGDLLKACRVGNTWVMECGANDPGPVANDGYNGTGEFYWGDKYSTDFHPETAAGAIAYYNGSNTLFAIGFDPNSTFEQGIFKLNQTTGASANNWTVDINSSFNKGNGMGDLEFITVNAPIEIGNKIWNDTDNDGIQDANELPIANVTVELIDSLGAVIASVTTDSNGIYNFTTLTGTDVIGTKFGTNILPNTVYSLRIAPSDWISGAGIAELVGLKITKPNLQGNGAPDMSDNDATLVSGIPIIPITTGDYGANNHTFDFGFFMPCVPPTASFTALNASCSIGGTPNNDGKISCTAFSNADKYGVSFGTTYTGPAYASATIVGIPTFDVQTSIPNSGGSYTIRFFNGADTCYFDTTISVLKNNCTVPCILPIATLTQSAPSCTVAGVPNNDGRISCTALSNADKYGVSIGTIYSGPPYAAATIVGTPTFDVQTSIPNTGGTYTIRWFEGGDPCFKDTTIIVSSVVCCGSNNNYLICPGGKYELTITDTTATGIQWFKDGIAIAGATSVKYNATMAGTYTYTAQNNNGCTMIQCCPIILSADPNCCLLKNCVPITIKFNR